MKLHAPLMLAMLAAGCAGDRDRPEAVEVGDTLAVTVLADSAEAAGLPPAARFAGSPPRLTLVRIAAARADVAAPLPVPEAADPPEAGRAAPAPEGDDALRPPIARGPATVRLGAARRGWLELDVRVDERGEVTDALFARGDADSATARAAIAAALAQRWYPAVHRGRPVAVWCRQRFEAGPVR
jgi:hypothetical protein